MNATATTGKRPSAATLRAAMALQPGRELQFQLRCIQTYNWGTFDKLREIQIAPQGHLVLGPSGSGKSTLLDGHTSLLTPPRWLDFNTAARSSEKGSGDRSLACYVRGAWATHTGDEGEKVKRYLRTGLRVGYTTRGVDPNNFIFTDQLIRDQSPTSVEGGLLHRISYLDIAAGGLYHTERFYAGASVDHLNRPNQSLIAESERLPLRGSLKSSSAGFSKRCVTIATDGAPSFSSPASGPSVCGSNPLPSRKSGPLYHEGSLRSPGKMSSPPPPRTKSSIARN